ncbi:M48 family metallopeptidase [Shewanella sp. UCD-KL21]|uniref:M48 family metallopeptidase n=1 Tax=Shewanella sp. UCD-KL21 TaxID=1917164 RepID=UPI000970628A|nr:M48 family metallopeptidase [Shewanella sp. UCD-KL21]
MIQQVSGHILAPKQATKYPASLVLGKNGMLTLASEIHSGQFQLDQTSVTDAIGNLARNITFASGHVFVSSEPTQLNQWLAVHTKTSLIAQLEKNLGLIFIATLVSLAMLYSSIVYGVPAASKAIAQILPDTVVQEVGEQTFSLIESMGFAESELTEQRQTELLQLFEHALKKLQQQQIVFPHEPKLLFYQSKDGANAFALADGHIILTDAMVKLASNDQQLEAVILHELGHVQHRHVLTNLIQSSILSVAAAFIVGDASGISDMLVSVTVLGTSLTYSRDHEREADQFAAMQLKTWYQSTDSIVELYLLLQAEHDLDIPDWASTHPNIEERIKTLKQ